MNSRGRIDPTELTEQVRRFSTKATPEEIATLPDVPFFFEDGQSARRDSRHLYTDEFIRKALAQVDAPEEMAGPLRVALDFAIGSYLDAHHSISIYVDPAEIRTDLNAVRDAATALCDAIGAAHFRAHERFAQTLRMKIIVDRESIRSAKAYPICHAENEAIEYFPYLDQYAAVADWITQVAEEASRELPAQKPRKKKINWPLQVWVMRMEMFWTQDLKRRVTYDAHDGHVTTPFGQFCETFLEPMAAFELPHLKSEIRSLTH